MKAKVLIVLPTQFGYHTDTFMYCKYINKDLFDVHYVGFNTGLDLVNIEGTTVHYVNCSKHKFIRYLSFFKRCIELKKHQFDIVFHVHAKFSLIFRLIFLFQNYVFDIRTGDLSSNRINRKLKNLNITLLSFFNSHVTVISESLAIHLKISLQKIHILPLGGELLHFPPKSFSDLKMLYIGTLSKRNIHISMQGLKLFIEKYPIKLTYDIIGSGSEEDVMVIKENINSCNLAKQVTYHGFIKYNNLYPYLEKANVGIVFIPQKEYYQFQPSTKLYEYLLAGMPVIATNTFENRRELATNPELGVLCEDTAESFCEGLEKIYQNVSMYNSEIIKECIKTSDWAFIVKQNLEPFLQKIIYG